ncbi:hypothetical protein AN478_06950 [Thiohalorhabdus denitrificans]|uniref:PLD-like domain-containing protein n=1 Tax=Thiohalorhabdus denitrificans TaxID=381306 RepID=A0A0P9C516_9GAMM|nr:phospholipase D family protein [Thiohalorhabdus denitrificans]KPV39928.1 hypothetical protein AN478_06950 [Thiohalorhabdus denitrificans]SCY08792.1 hypothetical protein SAMN05661077_1147 [Thiohalorhabdus denitrificans]
MLSPDAREVATNILRPPAGYRLDRTVMTTYSLDLEVLLALPLAVLAQADGGVEDLLEDPVLLLQALREASDRVHVYVDEAGIALPSVQRDLYGALDSSVHPVRAPGGGAFHPKVWVARFLSGEDEPLLRVAVASRNLTFDRSWDVALVSEAPPGEEAQAASQPLADLVRRLPSLGREPLGPELEAALEGIADELARTAFPAPHGFQDPIAFQTLGLDGPDGGLWQPVAGAQRLLAVSPFVGKGALDSLAGQEAKELRLVSRAEALDALPADALKPWENQHVLMEAALDEPGDDTAGRPSGLHAKLIAAEYGDRVQWYLGSANLTPAAFRGRNVEVMARLEAPLKPEGADDGRGIDAFWDGGFASLCMKYQRHEAAEEDQAKKDAQQALERQRDALLNAGLTIQCAPGEDYWQWRIEGSVPEVDGVTVEAWPVTLGRDHARPWGVSMEWPLGMERLTAFVAFRLRAAAEVDDVTLVAKLPAEGLPEGRMHRVLRTLIDSPERFLAFLRALLGGLEGLVDWAETGGEEGQRQDRGVPLQAETILEDLLRVASRDPERLDTVRRIMEDLAEEGASGEQVVPEDLYAIWQAVDAALQEEAQT